ncbi:hypothetical protein D3OALGA1CA_4831 [Olavius algarvensis associated proteobacterium Delta 3]|nr:hypothetical protein D3OALGB2SA_684 [Olavius algarvensis associated proteobacterium Delta 3]CAB5157587.1 hypothetical protein D3OALGA1CA_4831 [Olavius algarvensis associated proteobacterium Delta 3]
MDGAFELNETVSRQVAYGPGRPPSVYGAAIVRTGKVRPGLLTRTLHRSSMRQYSL